MRGTEERRMLGDVEHMCSLYLCKCGCMRKKQDTIRLIDDQHKDGQDTYERNHLVEFFSNVIVVVIW